MEMLRNEDSDDDKILTPDDVVLDYQIQKATQATLRHRGQIPFFRLGGGRIIRYRKSELERWLQARAVAVRP